MAREHTNGSDVPHGDARSDEALMQALVAGDDGALRELYARHAPRVFGIATRSLERAGAEEVVQDVFLALWRGATSFDPERGPLRPWLLQIAHRRILNELRGRRRRVQLEPDPDGEAEGALADPDPGPAALSWLAFRRSAVQSALGRLPAAQRQALALAFFEDLTHEQVAEALQLRLGTAKTRIRAGLRKLRAQLTPILAGLALVLTGVVAGLVARQHGEQAAAELQSRALDLVTSSDVIPLRLETAPGVASDTHATYRARPGTGLVVLTLSHFAAPPAGRTYQAWARHGAVWTSLGTAYPDANGHARLVAEGAALASAPDALEVTTEPESGSAEPSGPVLAAWPKPSDPVGDAAHE